jgi:hypothetical protein
MVPRIFLKNATDADRIFVRKWSFGISVFYAVFALFLFVVGFVSLGSKDTQEASRAPAANQTSSALDR